MSEPYASVRFEIDSKRLNVPQSYIKDFKASDFFPGMKAPVFWSNVEGETPTDVLRKQGHILELDKELDHSANSKQMTDEAVLSGYYGAEILVIADSKALLMKKMGSKRTSIPTGKVVAAKQEQIHQKEKKGPKKDAKDAYVSKERRKKNIKKSESITTQLLKKNFGYASESSSAADTDEEIFPASHFKDKILTLEVQISSFKRENKRLIQENEELRSLNFEWQRKVIGESSVRKQLFETKEGTSELVASSPGTSVWTVSPSKAAKEISGMCHQETKSGVLSSSSSEPVNETSSPVNETSSPVNETSSPLNESLLLGNECKSLAPLEGTNNIENREKTPEKQLEKQLETGSPYIITPRKIELAMTAHGSGKDNDCKFVKNLTQSVFGTEVLINSTYTGKVVVGGRKRKLKAQDDKRPGLSKKKLLAIENALRARVQAEVPKPSQEEEDLRTECMREAISDKIKYLRSKLKPSVKKHKTKVDSTSDTQIET